MLDRNWRIVDGELDLIVARRSLVVFVEVKTRSSAAFGSPAEAVTVSKQRRIRRLASAWLASDNRHWADIRFDVVSVLGGKIDVIEAAF